MDAQDTAALYEPFFGRPATDFLLHEAPMVVLDKVISMNDEGSICTCHTAADSLFYLPGQGVPGWAGIEFMAQCIAISSGARAKLDGRPIPLGLLLGTRHMTLNIDMFDAKLEYRAESRLYYKDDAGMAAHDCSIYQGDTLVAEARLTALEIREGKF